MSEGYNDTYNIIQKNGQDITIVMQKESDRKYDKFGTELKTVDDDPVNVEIVKAFPLRFNPSAKQLTEAGIDIKVSLLLYISKKELDIKNITIDSKRDKIRHDGIEYKIESLKPNGHNYDKFRSFVVGLNHA